jgi:hypothetical protein
MTTNNEATEASVRNGHRVGPDTAPKGVNPAVLIDGGCLLVVLNADDHLYELRQAVHEARRACGVPEDDLGEPVRLAQGGEILAEEFASVVRHDFEAELVLSDLKPLGAYVRSMIGTALVPEPAREQYVEGVLSYFSHLPGVVTIKTHPGCLVCS